MTLKEARPGERVRVVASGPGRSLAGIGIHTGDVLVVMRAAPFGGPLLVEAPSGARVAIGRSVAAGVHVEPSR